jgi:hypothetical protein
MQDRTIVLLRRFIGLTLLVSFLLFWGGAGLSLPLVDAKGASLFVLPSQQELAVITSHPLFWQWQSLLQLGGGVVAVLGCVLLTLLLWMAHERSLSLLGRLIFCFSMVLWVIIKAFRLGTGVWATQ